MIFQTSLVLWMQMCRSAVSYSRIVIDERFEPQITEVKHINDRILIVTLKMENDQLNIIAVYAPDAANHWKTFNPSANNCKMKLMSNELKKGYQ
ncbi:hypothetical protein M0802_014627 [Mischocyttarus mexicanus]|nr:hypothetical protein M0802_014627 [Mischocyttarus mexicanus]